MLQVIRRTGPMYIHFMQPDLVYLLNTTQGLFLESCNFGLVFPTDITDSAYSLYGSINTTPSHSLIGENDCIHINIKGSIIPKSGLTGLDGAVVTWSKARVGSTLTFQYDMLNIRRNEITWQAEALVMFNEPFEFARTYYTCNLVGDTVNVVDETRLIRMHGGVVFFASSTAQSGSPTKLPISAFVTLICYEYDPIRGIRSRTLLASKQFMQRIDSSTILFDVIAEYLSPEYYPYGAFYPCSTLAKTVTVNTDRSMPELEYSSILSHITDKADELLPVSIYKDVNWPELAYDAVQGMVPWDSNGIALSREIIGLRKEIGNILGLIKDIDNPKKWATMFLSYKYGLRLTIKDAISLIKSQKVEYAKHLGPAKVSSSTNFLKNSCNVEAHYAIYYERSAKILDELLVHLQQYDLFPNFGNIWDLVPFTFVVDWLVDFGGLFERLDSVATLGSYVIDGDMRSLKLTRTFDPALLGYPGYGGYVTLIKYVRKSSNICESPALVLDVPITKGFDHFVEAGALILQKLFH